MPSTASYPAHERISRTAELVLPGYAYTTSRAVRPVSEATEFAYSDDEDVNSESGFDYPHGSLSDGRRSQTTISTFEELPTPRSTLDKSDDYVQIHRPPSIQGPKGPHLFQTLQEYPIVHDGDALQLSPLETKQAPQLYLQSVQPALAKIVTPPSATSNCASVKDSSPLSPKLEERHVRSWSARDVGEWMYKRGFEDEIVQKFEQHDINGTVLVDMHFEELKELGIPSFGKRHQIWNELAALRRGCSFSPSDFSGFAIPEAPFSNTRLPMHQRSTSMGDPRYGGGEIPRLPIPRRGRFSTQTTHDIVSPSESVSIVAIEQIMPKIHKCEKGQDCPEWKKQQPLLNSIAREQGVTVADLTTASPVESYLQPASEVGPSVVGSSDILGPNPPTLAFIEGLCSVEKPDSRQNVEQFLNFQHLHSRKYGPPSPPAEEPLEMFPNALPPRKVLSDGNTPHQLPRLSIPAQTTPQDPLSAVELTARPSTMPPGRHVFVSSPLRNTSSPISYINRNGTPASEMDVPLTAFPLDPVARATSQSVPPNMQYREPSPPRYPLTHRRHQSAGGEPQNFSRRPAFALSPVRETLAATPTANAHRFTKGHTVPKPAGPKTPYGDATQHAGWMKKRRTKLLRHEWADAHFRLQGTTLAMHGSAAVSDQRPLDTIDVDRYDVACSSVGSNSKIGAALKSLKLKSGDASRTRRSSFDDTAFAFQLVPDTSDRPPPSRLARNVTHHFTVKTRDERIDWMREVMLAKAMKQKGAGYEVIVNGEIM